MTNKTIFALASGSLPSGVGIVRISGPAVAEIGHGMIGSMPPPRKASLRSIRHPASGAMIDEGVVVFFPGPKSFTGEDVLEFHCHGGRATIAAVFEALGTFDNCRPAEAGEFSRRAFENGRLDLTELEGLADLISAQTEQQRRLALSQSGGALRELYDDWRNTLIRSRALIEAEVDFADEDDVPDALLSDVLSSVNDLRDRMKAHLNDGRRGEIVRDGYRVVLAGPPNAGKSSLLNALARRDVAIVTDIAGTTRDVLDVSLEIDGNLVVVSDTAGMRESDDLVEQEGVRRAQAAAESADLVIWLSPADDPMDPVDGLKGQTNMQVVTSKTDLGNAGHGIRISTKSTQGLEPLIQLLREHLDIGRPDREEAVLTRSRHRLCVTDALAQLELIDLDVPIELVGEHLRVAADSLGRLTGRIDVEDLLDVIFSEFCVGK